MKEYSAVIIGGGFSGLGLAIVKHVCEIYEAKITFESKLGSGTKVTVTVPKK